MKLQQNIINLMKLKVERKTKHYKEDLNIDYKIIKENDVKKWLWIVRECGTNIARANEIGYFIWSYYKYQDTGNSFYFITENELKIATPKKLLEFFEDVNVDKSELYKLYKGVA